ncbi:IPExxxVDY family protein [Fulvivirga sedimenti]|uniref:IPExxxVDY family protein n=1 Tax=Fulvivirga sedimenti TaxID=2879465 RepID=A0A9X1HMU3_9BACT|nr:IPExxxVDY family protein [Fulvivirga sedimenti]MCA6073718.1 IPExxxVDY family protein [Fulvivirga sedimenti]
MKKNRLVIEYDYAFHLLGISSSVKFYKLAWAINQKLAINLIKRADYRLDLLQEPLSFEVYTHGEPDTQFWLYRNRSVSQDSQFLIPEYPHFDYLIKLPSDSQSFALKEMVKVLREVDLIEYIGALDVKTLKSRDNFLE